MAIAVGQRVVALGRTGVAIYDNTAAPDTSPSVIVLFNDSTYDEYARTQITTIAGGFIPGSGQ